MEFQPRHPMFRLDKRGRMKVKVIQVVPDDKKVIILKSILLPFYYEKTNWLTRLNYSSWDKIEIQLGNYDEVKRLSTSIFLSELRKGYKERDGLIGHQEPFEIDPHMD
jgi:hypothetical protein